MICLGKDHFPFLVYVCFVSLICCYKSCHKVIASIQFYQEIRQKWFVNTTITPSLTSNILILMMSFAAEAVHSVDTLEPRNGKL